MASEFQNLIKPLRLICAFNIFPCCFEYKKPRLGVAVCWILALNLLALDVELVFFTYKYSIEKDLSKVIVCGSLAIMHLYCQICGYMFISCRKQVAQLLTWCQDQHRKCQVSAESVKLTSQFVGTFITANVILVVFIFAGTIVVNLFASEIFEAYPIHLPGLSSDTFSKYLVNIVHQTIAAVYTILTSISFFTTFFVVVKYIYDRISFMISTLKKKKKVTVDTLRAVIILHVDVLEIFKILQAFSSRALLLLQAVIFPAAFLGWFGLTIDPSIRVIGIATSSLIVEFFFYFYINEMLIDKVIYRTSEIK